MPKLDHIYLINAAGFDEVEFPVGGHCQIFGGNGHGKSTLLRAVLFFYLGTNDKPPYSLDETKKDLISYYLAFTSLSVPRREKFNFTSSMRPIVGIILRMARWRFRWKTFRDAGAKRSASSKPCLPTKISITASTESVPPPTRCFVRQREIPRR